jgi:acetyltransferase
VTIRNLEFAVQPKSVAVIGASSRVGSVGDIVVRNILAAGFSGQVFAVNPKHREVAGLKCHGRISDLPAAPDLAVIVTPAATVPAIIGELGQKGTRAAVVITAGLTRENGLRQAMLDAARPHLLRIIGPNTLGLMVPKLKLNASFSHMAANPGGLALLSQSGAIATSLVDWAAENGVGFSHLVSLGDMADVDAGDYINKLAGDVETKAILLYLESIPDPRKFMSAARAAARIKPVIAIKSGRHEAAARAAATHTGALTGADRVTQAAFDRAGIIRVHGLAELFDTAETLARFKPLEFVRVGIVTNGGGAGVLAVDQLQDCGGKLAVLSAQTVERLDKLLPSTWSKANPVDIIGDANAERYRAAVGLVAQDAAVDALLILNCPTGLVSPGEAASAVAALTDNGTINGKPVLACWLGEKTARRGREILQDAGVASFETPAAAAKAVSYLSDWSRSQKALMLVPPRHAPNVASGLDAALPVFRQAAGEGRSMLSEVEAKTVISAYGIAVPETMLVRSAVEAGRAAGTLLKKSKSVAVKLVSKTLTHKSDIGGVVLDVETAEEAHRAAEQIAERVRTRAPESEISGFAVQPMIMRKQASELILGVSQDPVFGPVLMFGAGGTAVEVIDDISVALPPIDEAMALELIGRTRIGKLLAGYRDTPPADQAAIAHALCAMSQIVVDLPCIKSLDINPLLADHHGVIALDARIEFDPGLVGRRGPHPGLAIRPYPSGWNKDVAAGARRYLLRPIKPSDADLYPDFLAKVSPDDLRLRFLAPQKEFSSQMLTRLTQLDYDREMAFVALDADAGALAGIGRLSSNPDKTSAEFGLLVRTDLQGQGIGRALLQQLVDFAKADRIGMIEGMVLNENSSMLTMCKLFGFQMAHKEGEPGVSAVSLNLAVSGPALPLPFSST